MKISPHPQTPPRYGRIPQVTRDYGFNRSRIYELLAASKITAVKDGRALLIDLGSVEEYLAGLPKAAVRLPRTLAKQAAANAIHQK